MSKNKKSLLLAHKRGYRVLNDGRLLSSKNKIIKLYMDVKGYLYFTVKMPDRKTGHVYVHRLMAYQKYGNRIFEKGIEVRHFDNKKLNNKKGNILIGTHSENMMDIPGKERLRISFFGADTQRKLTSKQLLKFRNDRKNGFTLKMLVEKYKISKSTVSYIVNGKTYKTFRTIKI